MAEKTPAITRYNNKTYRIEDIDWERNMKHTFDKTWKKGETKTLSHVQHYQEKYQKTITDPLPLPLKSFAIIYSISSNFKIKTR